MEWSYRMLKQMKTGLDTKVWRSSLEQSGLGKDSGGFSQDEGGQLLPLSIDFLGVWWIAEDKRSMGAAEAFLFLF